MANLAEKLASIRRPDLSSHHSSSLPSTPYQQARKISFGARSPSPEKLTRDGSPKSNHSETENGVRSRSKAPSIAGCKYETGMAFSRRRIPYSIGGDQLERAKALPKKFLNPDEEGKLSGDMRELYDRILPSPESDQKRADFTSKLDQILNDQWPGNGIKVHVFGSSGNKLCTNESDGEPHIHGNGSHKPLQCLMMFSRYLCYNTFQSPGTSMLACERTSRSYESLMSSPTLHC